MQSGQPPSDHPQIRSHWSCHRCSWRSSRSRTRLACVWGIVGNNFSTNEPIDLDTWYVEERRRLSWVQKHQLTDARPFELYSVALYVSLSNIFGGPCEIAPANYLEYSIQAVMMLIGSSLWAYIIGYGCGIVTQLNPSSSEHRRIVGMLNFFVEEHKIEKVKRARGLQRLADHAMCMLFSASSAPPSLPAPHQDLAHKLRMFYNETSLLRYYEANSTELMGTMTPQLRGASSLVAAHHLFAKVSFLSKPEDFESEFLSKAALSLTSAIYCPREQIPTEQVGIRLQCVPPSSFFSSHSLSFVLSLIDTNLPPTPPPRPRSSQSSCAASSPTAAASASPPSPRTSSSATLACATRPQPSHSPTPS